MSRYERIGAYRRPIRNFPHIHRTSAAVIGTELHAPTSLTEDTYGLRSTKHSSCHFMDGIRPNEAAAGLVLPGTDPTQSTAPAPSPELRILDAGLLGRYDLAGPRYTSYPTSLQFRPDFRVAEYEDHARRSNTTVAPRPLSLYVHIPFCTSPCFYCGCNRIITRDTGAGNRYVVDVLREAAMRAPLFDQHREVRQLHLGGGTPNFLRQDDMSRLIEGLGGLFRFSPAVDRDFSIELDPRFSSASAIEHLARLGFNRASLGVQDFDARVQEAVNRLQTREQTLEIVEACRMSGFRSINIDLIYGLPNQTLQGFTRTLQTVIAARPDRLAVYGYAHLPQLFKAQRHIDPRTLPGADARLALLALAIDQLGAAGYRFIGMDHFALPEDDLSLAQNAGGLHRNFMGYTTHADCDLLGLGMSAISHVGESFSQNQRDLGAWTAALDAGHLPIWRGLSLSRDDVLRAEIIQRLMCDGAVDFRRIEAQYRVVFEDYFAEAREKIDKLARDGLVVIEARRLRATERGRFLLRILAMCFDRYLDPTVFDISSNIKRSGTKNEDPGRPFAASDSRTAAPARFSKIM
jgi:oxygen-independent coproporphyrinogen III oxidase